MPDRVDLTTGDRVEHFEIQNRLGEGAFGIVYRVLDLRSRRECALKILKLWEVTKKDRVNLIKRFELEFETGRIESNYLVHTTDNGCFKGNPFIVMEFCSGGDLRKQMRRGLSLGEITKFAQHILFGLHALHTNGKTHRDLKPENVLLDAPGNARLTDFGIVGHANLSRLTQMDWLGRPKEVFGTPAYMPPEQLDPRNKKHTILPTLDVFAFGVMVYEMFTGHYPFGQPKDDVELGAYVMRVNKGQYENPQQYNPGIPQHWLDIIHTCLQPDLSQRFQNVELILKRLGSAPAPSAPTAATVPRTKTGDWGMQIMQGEDFGHVYNLSRMVGTRTSGVLRVGWLDRSGAVRNDIAIKEEQSSYISRAHATVEKNGDQWQIRDGQFTNKDGVTGWHRSMNGTYVNGSEVSANVAKPLKPDDIITVGNTTLKVVIL